MPSRLLREGILTSERIDQLEAQAEVFYRRLMSKVDDHGLYDARFSILRSSLYPLRVDRVREADIARWLAACQAAGVIALYQHDGKPFLRMLDTRWEARSKPKYPPPSENNSKQVQTPVPVFEVVGVVVDVEVPSGLVAGGDPYRPPDCPYEQIQKLYHEHCPTMARVRVMTNMRMKHMRARWVEVTTGDKLAEPAGLDWFKWFFERANSSPFLSGRSTPGKDARVWKADLEWLMTAGNFAKVLEGRYHKEAA